MKSSILAVLLLAVAVPATAQTTDEKTVTTLLARLITARGDDAPLDQKTVEAQMRSMYTELIKRSSTQGLIVARRRGQLIGEFFAKDMDNDGNITSEELREALVVEASRPLMAVDGATVEPTKEQVETIISQLLMRELRADENGDGTIDSAEVRQHANARTLEDFHIADRIDLKDVVTIRVLDTSGDKTISLAELIEGAGKVLVMMDTNKDGVVSLQEAQAFTGARNTF